MQPYEQLERDFGNWIGNPNTISCASGTAALHLALESLQLPLGSRVIVPEMTMVACTRAVTMAGLVPIFVDCTDNLLLDSSKLPDCLTVETEAVMAVHVYGRRCPMDSIVSFAREASLRVIEDMAEIHGVHPHPRTDAACWSFYQNKIVAGEEGGMVAFQQCTVPSTIARSLRTLGFNSAHDFLHRPRAWNHRLSNAHAKLILESLSRYEENQRARRQIEQWYDWRLPAAWRMPPRDAVWVYDLRIPPSDHPVVKGVRLNACDIVAELNSSGVPGARMAFKPMSEQPEYRGHFRHLNAYRLSREVLYLPVNPAMTEGEVDQIVETLKKAVYR
jgi:perosamine synthetase